MLLSCFLQTHINLSVRAHSSDIAFHSVASMNVLEYLVLIEQTRVLVVNDDLEAEVCLLPDQQVHFVAMTIVRMFLRQVSLHLGRCYDAIALLVNMYVNDV